MTRHTTEFLRQKSSNMSLRMAASSASALASSRLSSFANPAEPRPSSPTAPPPSPAAPSTPPPPDPLTRRDGDTSYENWLRQQSAFQESPSRSRRKGRPSKAEKDKESKGKRK
ncbi:hypothetical protein ONZ43_g664 [Nemania bipapillata]|uniref:Uncharacterized protein n=1 Tax=Nemania bipapillata TaxID=110536 RepID=A0ACC2J7V5_9PEZI|nr:hypothetical protein ONZ43_g664 [Nemania bipapillata]